MSQTSITINISSEDITKMFELLTMMNINVVNQQEIPTANMDTTENSVENDSVMTDDDREDLDEEYVVQEIVDHRQESDGSWSFHILWAGYEEYSWIRESECNCDELIAKYLKKVGIKTVYIICRVSTNNQSRDGHVSLEMQEADLRETLNNLFGHIDRGTYRIKVISFVGSVYKKTPRPFKDLEKYANPNDLVMAWKVDRLGRNMTTAVAWLNALHNKGVRIFARHENIFYAPDNNAFMRALLEANEESRLISDRVKSALDYKRNRGDRVGNLSYGLKYTDVLDFNGKIVGKTTGPDLQKQEVLDAFEELAADTTLPNNEIARMLNARGLYKYQGKKWTTNMVRYMRYPKNPKKRENTPAKPVDFWTVNRDDQPESSSAASKRQQRVEKRFMPY